MGFLGRLFKRDSDEGTPYSESEGSFDALLSAAENGDAESQFSIGCAYHKGDGVQQSDVKAFEWFRKAAENGDARARFNVGFMYCNGIGVQQSYERAIIHYQKAVNMGCTGNKNVFHIFCNILLQ